MFPSQNNSGILRSPHPRQQPENGGQSSSPIPRKIGNFSTPTASSSKGKGFSASISAISTTNNVSTTFPRHRPQQQHFSEAKRNTPSQQLSSPIRRPRNFDFTNANSSSVHSRKPFGVAEQTKSCPRPIRNVNALQHTKSVPPQKATNPTVLRTVDPGKARLICLNVARPLACIYVRLLAANIAAVEAKMEGLRKQLSDEQSLVIVQENNGPNVVETTPRRPGRDREGDSSNEFEATLLFSLGVQEVREHKLRAPETVCIGEKCLRKTTNCHRKSQPLFYVPCSGVKARESCSICGCPWTEHMQVGFHLCLSERTVDILAMGKKGGAPLTPHSLNKNNGNRKSAIDKALQNLNTLFHNYRTDVDAVMEFAAKCSIFLCSGNEMENEEDFVRTKFEQELREEEILAEVAGKSEAEGALHRVDFRQNCLERYTRKREAIPKQQQRTPTTAGRSSVVSPEEITEGLEELFQRLSAQTCDLLKKLIRF